MACVLSVPARVVFAICFPVLLPLRLAWSRLRTRGERRGVVWSAEALHAAAHEIALLVWPPVAAAGAWALYRASGWGPGGVGGDVRGAVLGWLAAGVVVLAVHGARHGEVPDESPEPAVPAHPLRHLAGYGALFSMYLVVAMVLVVVPVALILSI